MILLCLILAEISAYRMYVNHPVTIMTLNDDKDTMNENRSQIQWKNPYGWLLISNSEEAVVNVAVEATLDDNIGSTHNDSLTWFNSRGGTGLLYLGSSTNVIADIAKYDKNTKIAAGYFNKRYDMYTGSSEVSEKPTSLRLKVDSGWSVGVYEWNVSARSGDCFIDPTFQGFDISVSVSGMGLWYWSTVYLYQMDDKMSSWGMYDHVPTDKKPIGVCFGNNGEKERPFPIGLSASTSGESYGFYTFEDLKEQSTPVLINKGEVTKLDTGYCENMLCFNIKYYFVTILTAIAGLALLLAICWWLFCKGGCKAVSCCVWETCKEIEKNQQKIRNEYDFAPPTNYRDDSDGYY